jgi:hypothetical protein
VGAVVAAGVAAEECVAAGRSSGVADAAAGERYGRSRAGCPFIAAMCCRTAPAPSASPCAKRYLGDSGSHLTSKSSSAAATMISVKQRQSRGSGLSRSALWETLTQRRFGKTIALQTGLPKLSLQPCTAPDCSDSHGVKVAIETLELNYLSQINLSVDSPSGPVDSSSTTLQPCVLSTAHANAASPTVPTVQANSINTPHRRLEPAGRHSIMRVKATGAPAMPKPTHALLRSSS